MRTFIGLLMLASLSATAQVASVDIKDVKGRGIGRIIFEDSRHGLLIKPHLTGMASGLHGLHVHEHPTCAKKGQAAGGHFDPQKTGKHLGPFANGHLGDLPALYVDNAGKAAHVLLAPRLKVAELKGHSVMIHQGGDNYSDSPQALGGGGARIACGVLR